MKQDEEKRDRGCSTQLYFTILPKAGTVYPQLKVEKQIAQRSVLMERGSPLSSVIRVTLSKAVSPLSSNSSLTWKCNG